MTFQPLHALGLMSGTSMDAVDVAHLTTDGETIAAFGPVSSLPYSDEDRALLRAAMQEATSLTSRTARPGLLAAAEARVDACHIEAVKRFRAEFPRAPIALIGYHGQTVLHRPAQRLTVQLGRGAVLADALGVPVMSDMRADDIAAGGQGAPLVPVYHCALLRQAGLMQQEGLPRAAALLNIGGVANLTYLAASQAEPIACDTGPGNALLDDLMMQRLGVALDRDGATAARGNINEAALAKLLDHRFFDQPPPKSLDRNGFSAAPVQSLTIEDAAATLTAFSAAALGRLTPFLPAPLSEVIVCGGGARNPTMLEALRRELGCLVTTAEHHGWSSDAMEAQAFAFLAVRALRGLPLTFPGTTGCPQPMTGGRLDQPQQKG